MSMASDYIATYRRRRAERGRTRWQPKVSRVEKDPSLPATKFFTWPDLSMCRVDYVSPGRSISNIQEI